MCLRETVPALTNLPAGDRKRTGNPCPRAPDGDAGYPSVPMSLLNAQVSPASVARH
jgi:hypothetical protein